MTLLELNPQYAAEVENLAQRLQVLREELRRMNRKKKLNEIDQNKKFKIERRIYELQKIYREQRVLEELTRRYYERGYWRDERYTLNHTRNGRAKTMGREDRVFKLRFEKQNGKMPQEVNRRGPYGKTTPVSKSIRV